jgi:hypothetical protein
MISFSPYLHLLLSQGLTPVAFLLSPSKMNFPVDLALGVMLPLHGETDCERCSTSVHRFN